MTVDQMRVELERAYPHSFQWKQKMKTWDDRRIIRVYHEFLNSNRFEKLKKRRQNDGVQLKMDI